jgi:hypothetical protein
VGNVSEIELPAGCALEKVRVAGLGEFANAADDQTHFTFAAPLASIPSLVRIARHCWRYIRQPGDGLLSSAGHSTA